MKKLIKQSTKKQKLLFMLMFAFISLAAYAATVTATIDEITYTSIDGTTEAAVTGTTANSGKGPKVDNLIIPETVTIDGSVYTVTTINKTGSGAFKSATQVTLPNSITTLATEAFSYCRTVTTLDFSNTKITNVGTSAFKNTSTLSVLKLPSTVVSLGSDIFTGSTVSKFFMYATDPTVIDLYSDKALISLVGKSVTLYVPAASVDAYKNHAIWGTTFTDIQAITDDANAATAISLSDGPETFYPTQTTTLTVSVEPTGADMGTVTWSATPATVATIDPESGLITAVAAGTVTIKAEMNGLDATKDITVTALPAPTSISIPASLNLVEDDDMTLSVTYEGGELYDKSITWSSSDESKVSVDQTGKIVALAVTDSAVTITAKSTVDNAIYATCAVSVESKIKLNSISIDFDLDEIILGSEYTLTYTVDPQDSEIETTWSSNNLDVITIDATTGELATVGTGEATITISVKNSNTQASVTISVIKTAERAGVAIPEDISAGDTFTPSLANPRSTISSEKWTMNGYSSMTFSAGENVIRGEITYTDGTKDVIVKYVNIQ